MKRAHDVALEPATTADARHFVRFERAPDARAFVLPSTHAEHVRAMADERLVYLCIMAGGALAGFCILALDADGVSVEFRRIVVARGERGIGQRAIALLDGFCRERLGRSRIWLDVFADNARARHLYAKLGYAEFGAARHGERRLVLYEKAL